MNTNFEVIGLTRLGIKPESTAPEADALTTRPSEMLKHFEIHWQFAEISHLILQNCFFNLDD